VKPRTTAIVPGGLKSFAVDPRSPRLLALDAQGSLRNLTRPGLQPLALPAGLQVTRLTTLAFSGDGRYLATGDLDKQVTLRDGRSLQAIFSLPAGNGIPETLAFDREGGMLALGVAKEQTVVLWDLTSVRSTLARLGLP
jgi:WD40 repeat protein